jgi:hypothetical protein
MTFTTHSARVGAAVVAALLLMSATISSAGAQALPFKAYGAGLRPGAAVEAFKGTTSYGRTTVDAAGQWQIDIKQPPANNGDVIGFKLDGLITAQTITFMGGLFVPIPGLALTVPAGTVAPPVVVPTPAKTGSAGLTASTPASSIALVLALGALSLGAVVSGRVLTRRSAAVRA